MRILTSYALQLPKATIINSNKNSTEAINTLINIINLYYKKNVGIIAQLN